MTYKHSVEMDVDKCTGCTTCMKRCPTQAIRVRDGKAVIDSDRCIDCGECIKLCPNGAKKALSSKLENHLDKYKYKIALPPPSLFGQFEGLTEVDDVLQGLLNLGFDDVFEVAKAAEIITEYTRLYLKTPGIKKPVISSACPAVVRLIALRYPYLRDNILPLMQPMELAAKLAKEKAHRDHPELKDEEIGTFFISPCAAKVSFIRNGYGESKSHIDVVVSLKDVYFMLLSEMKKDFSPTVTTEAGMIGLGWASSGGESSAILNDNYLAADGIENINAILNEIEDGKISQLDFVELNACSGGCVGGNMTINNPFISKTRLQNVRRYMPVAQNRLPKGTNVIPEDVFFAEFPEYMPISRLSNSFSESMRMMAKIEEIVPSLPGLDCGACGSPSCRVFAEDIVRGNIPGVECCPVKKGLSNEGK